MIWNYTDKAALTMKKMSDEELKEYLETILDLYGEDEYEEFYEEYGYEPDEQSKEVQEKSICKIERSNIKKWIDSIFDKKLTKNIRMKITY